MMFRKTRAYRYHLSAERGQSSGALFAWVAGHCLDVKLTGGLGVCENGFDNRAALFAG